VTYDNRATGERIELSVATFDNWVSKIANLLTDDLDLDPGATISVDLPTHWQSAVTIVGAWTAGLRLVAGDQSADVVVVGPGALTTRPADEAIVVACSLRPFGVRFSEPLPEGWLDFAVEVPAQPDILLNPCETSATDMAATLAGVSATHDDLAEAARREADAHGLARGGRIATDANPATPDGLVTALVAPLLVDGSVVLVAGADQPARESVVRQEGATCTYWTAP
jgi:uncharacterized protein (TIGR03089 family)